MTDSQVAVKAGKRQRLVDAAVQVFYERGIEKTTIADIAKAAEVPVGNVYYYFKTKDQLIEAAVEAHRHRLGHLLAELDGLGTPRERLRALIAGWVDLRDQAARFGCPFGTLASEMDKRPEVLDAEIAATMRVLVDWAQRQFEQMGRADAAELGVALIAAYQGISLLTNTFRDPGLMRAEGDRLARWIDSLAA
ncbi:TetR/AcrR family transcriptional regulator [Nocardia cyriacigeorgica]|jgi:TetR/AcrR family transcriptional regulator, transcriptional repressor for nem operon|uniref:TetR/AcrR family transcriptional regulator n=1 Tax=Nocardia cyriacigeorgica TaxID=135487 RepID=UPI00055E86DD|nr:TetR/AcrR family transcriptional regulator [Nocardia cyriacigeorgica]AVH23193.1 TetR/AcrR family transcriptional regulator [Nocardia cyriacigeorgica]MBF6087990.1 TetR/AcrR family transcriptional regulator [Nocardia cyriacigeorgica]MBF6094093.1 TetR/AcrR family transcriptional regulator [Nocardia cyriacigeorgica]MBF6322724.1 TetR/AcrR family transcriptional regulator [Nocardia cyriacigeorgica]MBF6396271.1 TetR/AcrR family transcriptional regulator [Nocardia cyriacigeorgica]